MTRRVIGYEIDQLTGKRVSVWVDEGKGHAGPVTNRGGLSIAEAAELMGKHSMKGPKLPSGSRRGGRLSEMTLANMRAGQQRRWARIRAEREAGR